MVWKSGWCHLNKSPWYDGMEAGEPSWLQELTAWFYNGAG